MNQIKQILIVLICVLPQFVTGQQITSNALYAEETAYPNGENDPVFFFSSMSDARLNAPVTAGATYNWYSYNVSTGTFDVLEQTGGDALMAVSENGYRVEVNVSGSVDNYYCWNFVPEPAIDSIGTTPDSEACNNLRLTAHHNSKMLVYYNHKGDGDSQLIDYGYNWTSVPTGDMDGETVVSKSIAAPTEDTDYSVTIGQKFAAVITPVTESLPYEAIAVTAAFSYESEDTPENEANEGSAPMVVRYTDESLGNVTDWEWTFGESGKDYVPDPIFTFQDAGEFPVTLWVMNSDSGCEDQTGQEIFTVNEIVLKVPDAFTPFSSPGKNDEFKVLYRSIKKYRIVIYNRWGRRVYTSTDPAEGWNGRIGNRKAEPGVYFYDIEAEGFNEGEKLTREGAIHLIITTD